MAWLVVKVVFVLEVIPGRDTERSPRTTAERKLRHSYPKGTFSTYADLKDEGILFYYGPPSKRMDKLDDLFKTTTPRYCVLTAAEWKGRPAPALARLLDEQGDPIVLTRIEADSSIEQSPQPK